ncbi:MAG: hypothetical protein NTV52_34075 [Acidobacteria bacterium]|nr:hypothetical protein [Acidobacteriota bacterium]
MNTTLALFVTNQSTFDQMKREMLDDTFAGVHSLALFDYMLIVPYFVILLVLSFYGMHRYAMIRGYFKFRGNLLTTPPQLFAELPPVTIQLPLFNERFVVERLIETIVDPPVHRTARRRVSRDGPSD